MKIDPVSAQLKPFRIAEAPAGGTTKANASRQATATVVDPRIAALVASLPFPAENRRFALGALADLSAEFGSGKPDLAREEHPGSSLGAIIRSDAVFAAAALRLFVDVHSEGHKALAIYEELRRFIPPEVVDSGSPRARAVMNSFAAPVHPPMGSLARPSSRL
jgi:hypothetical protein